MKSSFRVWSGLALAGSVTTLGAATFVRTQPEPSAQTQAVPRSSDVLGLLSAGEEKRRLVLDCTGCHTMGMEQAFPAGRARTEQEWETIVTRMLGYAGATTRFPVIAERDPKATAAFLARHLTAPPRARAASPGAAAANVREYLLPNPQDLPHDLQVLGDGRVLITGMMTDRMYLLNVESGAVDEVPVPVQRANPRAVELAANGDWWVLLGAANKVARYRPASREWSSWDIGMYGHSIAIDAERGRVWFNGHFTRDPSKIGYVDAATGEVRTLDAPRHPTLAARPGGPIPYELRLGPDGTVWYSELQGNRILGYAPASGEWRTFDMPTAASGPRRFDVDARGVLWIPGYSANTLVRLDPAAPAARRFREYPLPIADAVPYVARVDRASGRVWIGTSAADAVLVFNPATERFTTIHLPIRGAMIRHMAIDPKTRDVWLAYGASPGIAARVARVRLGAAPAG